MERDISYYCRKYNCGKCCERGWDIFVTDAEIRKWEAQRPEIVAEITSGVFDGERKKLLKKRKVTMPNGKSKNLCVFYDFEKKCLIQADKPDVCKKFSCFYHPYFLFRFFYEISHLESPH